VSLRAKRILIAAAIGLFVAIIGGRVDAEFTRLGVPVAATYLNCLIIGTVAAVCAFGWVSLQTERNSRLSQAAAERLREEGVLHERARIAREIHDTLAQGFAGIILSLEAAEEHLGKSPQARQQCDRALRIGRESLAEARAMVRGLRSQTQEGKSLQEAVARIVESLTVGSDLRVNSFVEEFRGRITLETEAELLHIIKEALTNVARHAHAREAHVTLRTGGNQIQLCVEDDGRGFECEDPLTAEGFGLTSMRERAKNAGGILWVYSRPGEGTQVIACIPLRIEARNGKWETTSSSESSSRTTIRSFARASKP
jgi:signal transduction histidine kinase